MTPSPYVVETAGLTKRFGSRTVVQDVELQVPRGSAFGYLGPNGAWKTTPMRMLLRRTAAAVRGRRGPPNARTKTSSRGRPRPLEPARILTPAPELLTRGEPMNGL